MAAVVNALALLRFGHFHFAHFGRGGSGFLLLIGLIFAAILIWAITRPQRRES
jgi:hypothetical protein